MSRGIQMLVVAMMIGVVLLIAKASQAPFPASQSADEFDSVRLSNQIDAMSATVSGAIDSVGTQSARGSHTETATATTTPKPTKTPLSLCYGEETPLPGTRCNPRSPTPTKGPIEASTVIVTPTVLLCRDAATQLATGERKSQPFSCVWT